MAKSSSSERFTASAPAELTTAGHAAWKAAMRRPTPARSSGVASPVASTAASVAASSNRRISTAYSIASGASSGASSTLSARDTIARTPRYTWGAARRLTATSSEHIARRRSSVP